MKAKLLQIEEVIVKLPKKIKELYSEIKDEVKDFLPKIKDIATTNYKLGIYHIENGNMRDAKLRFMLLTKLKPEMAMPHYHLGRCHLFNLDFDKAKQEFETSLSLDKDLFQAQYRLDVLNHKKDISFIPTEVTKEDHNTLSKSYEKYVLNQLDYKVPKILIEEMLEFIKKTDKVIDLGSGTGLVGMEIMQNAPVNYLMAVDISTKMLDLTKSLKIENKEVYNKVQELDFNNLISLEEKFDVIVSCMSFGYVNDLVKIFEQVNTISYKDSIFGLVVLKADGSDIKFNYDYATLSFSDRYLESIFKKSKWSVKKKQEISIYDDKTIGLMYILEKN